MTEREPREASDVPGDNIDAIRGTHTFENVLYSREDAQDRVPVDVRTGEPTVGVSPEEKAKRFAEQTTREDGHQRVAVPQTTEAMVETQSAPYVSVVFFHRTVVRGRAVGTGEDGQSEYANDGHALATAYRAAIQSDAYEVELVDAVPEGACVRYEVCENEVPERGQICGPCLDALRAADHDRGERPWRIWRLSTSMRPETFAFRWSKR